MTVIEAASDEEVEDATEDNDSTEFQALITTNSSNNPNSNWFSTVIIGGMITLLMYQFLMICYYMESIPFMFRIASYTSLLKGNSKGPDIQRRVDATCNYNQSCWDQVPPNRTLECLVQPNASFCRKSCFDILLPPSSQEEEQISSLVYSSFHYQSYTRTIDEHDNYNDTLEDQMWPPMGQGEFVFDPEYCTQVAGTIRHCFMDRYRYSIPTNNQQHNEKKENNNRRMDNVEAHRILKRNKQGVSLFRPFSSAKEACAVLHSHNITDIMAIGDSLTRHITQALLIVLSDNYDFIYGDNSSCHGHAAFATSECRKLINREYTICPYKQGKHSHSESNVDNSSNTKSWWSSFVEWISSMFKSSHTYSYITVRQIKFSLQGQHSWDLFPGEGPGKTLYIYGVGSHASNPAQSGALNYTEQERLTIYNASAYQQDKWADWKDYGFWHDTKAPDHRKDYFVWVPPHYKIRIPAYFQTNEKLFQYIKESHSFFAQRGATTLNTFSLTQQAAQLFCINYQDEANDVGANDAVSKFWGTGAKVQYLAADTMEPSLETYDGCHYSRNLNVIKAHMLLHHVDSLPNL